MRDQQRMKGCFSTRLALVAWAAAGLMTCQTQAQTFMGTGVDLGAPTYPGSITLSATTNTIKAGGADIWNATDGGYFYYTNITSPAWDAMVRVHDLRSPGDGWGKCELMVRQDQGTGAPATDGGDAFIAEMTTQPSSYTGFPADGPNGQNWVVDQFRTVHNGNADWIDNTTWPGVSHAYTAGNPSPAFPNQWLRLKRQGSVFTTFDSTDGTTWNTSAVIDTGNPLAQPAGNDNATRFNTGPWTNSVFVGVAVTAHTQATDPNDPNGGLYFATAVFSDLSITISTDLLLVSGSAAADDVMVSILDVAPSSFDPTASGNLNVTIGTSAGTNAVTPASNPKANGVTTLHFPKPYPNQYASGSTVAVHVEAKSTTGKWFTNDLAVGIPPYATIPADTKLTAQATAPGMSCTTFQLPQDNPGYQRTQTWGANDANRIRKVEQQLVGGYFDFLTGTPFANQASPVNNNVDYVNWEQLAGDINTTPENGPDFFNSARPADNPVPNLGIPGIDTSGAWNDYIVVETVTFLRFTQPGLYRMGVTSDDGFLVTAGQLGPLGLQIGAFDGTRGAAESAFEFVVTEAGDYPFRLLYWEGNGGANCEWYMIDRTTGTNRYLINGPQNNPLALKAFRTGQPRAYVQSISPANNYYFTDATTPLKIAFGQNTATTASSVKLFVNGTDVTASAVSGTTVSYKPSGGFPYSTVINGQLVWQESSTPATTWTNSFRFCTGGPFPYQFPTGSFWIEGEDFDYGSGQHVSGADTMPYTGDAFLDLGAVANVDYNNDDALSDTGIVYRYLSIAADSSTNALNPYVDIATSSAATIAAAPMLTMERPSKTTMTANYKIGWSSGADWYNYTRKLPANQLYTAYAALSQDSGIDSPFSNPTTISATLGKVTAGVGTSSQTVQSAGTFTGPSTGGWSANSLVPLKLFDGTPGYVKADPTTTTLKVAVPSGDWDYFILWPVTGIPPKVVSATPYNANVSRDVALDFVIRNMSANVQVSTIKLNVAGTDVAAQATATADGATVHYKSADLWPANTPLPYVLSYTDDASKASQFNGSFSANYPITVGAGAFLIEAEDFDYDGGKHMAAADTMPYVGGAYATTGAKYNIDYHNDDALANASTGTPAHPLYRYDASGTGDLETDGWAVSFSNDLTSQWAQDRGAWSVNVNYRMGWVGSPDWENYTRAIPKGSYNVYAALSYGGSTAGTPHGMLATLQQVTAGLGTTNQTLANLGSFDAPSSGAWGRNELVQMQDTSGNPAVLTITGDLTTLRMNSDLGDFDYFMLLPSSVTPKPTFGPVTLNSDGSIKVTWTGGGTLQVTPSLTPPIQWTDVTGATSPYTFTPTQKILFGRVKQ
jgi:hypothetical protein